MADRIFLLSPANSSGKRASQLLSPNAEFDLARALRSDEGAPLGEVFAFMSSLYFRGKLAYARAFAASVDHIHVITPGDGLVSPDRRVGPSDLKRFAGVPVDPENPRYREPLVRDLRKVADATEGDVVLLGSIASEKYVELLLSVLDTRAVFPADFVGRGDMSRGGLMLRAAEVGIELRYVRLLGSARRGKRPPKLPPKAWS